MGPTMEAWRQLQSLAVRRSLAVQGQSGALQVRPMPARLRAPLRCRLPVAAWRLPCQQTKHQHPRVLDTFVLCGTKHAEAVTAAGASGGHDTTF